MQLILSTKIVTVSFNDVLFKDGHIPILNGLKLELPSIMCNSETVNESVAWFKVLVFDEMHINCVQRVLLLKRLSHDHAKNSGTTSNYCPQLTRQLSERDDPLFCEIFDKLEEILTEYKTSKSMTEILFKDIIIKLLHYYVLPIIFLNVEDLLTVKSVLKVHLTYISELDNKIISRNSKLQEINSSLYRQRIKFVDDLQSSSSLLYPKDFSDLLASDVNKEIITLRNELAYAQKGVEEAKKVDCSVTLNEKRKIRNEYSFQLERFLFAYGSLKDRYHFKKSTLHTNELQNVYIMTKSLLEEEIKNITELADLKVKLLHVKEALSGSIKDLESGSRTLGVYFQFQSVSDIVKNFQKSLLIQKSWSSVSEKALRLLNNKRSSVSKYSRRFCSKLSKDINNLVELLPTIHITSCNVSSSNNLSQKKVSKTSNVSSSSSSSALSNFSTIDYIENQKCLEDYFVGIGKDICLHFSSVSLLLQEKLGFENSISNSSFRKLWLTYEKFFFQTSAMFPIIFNLYFRFYESKTLNLLQSIPNLRLEDFKMEQSSVFNLISSKSMVKSENSECSNSSINNLEWVENLYGHIKDNDITSSDYEDCLEDLTHIHPIYEDNKKDFPSTISDVLTDSSSSSAYSTCDNDSEGSIKDKVILRKHAKNLSQRFNTVAGGVSTDRSPNNQFVYVKQHENFSGIKLPTDTADQLRSVEVLFRSFISFDTIFSKLEKLQEVLHELNHCIAENRIQSVCSANLSNKNQARHSTSIFKTKANTEEIIDLLIVFLCENRDGYFAIDIYPHVMMLVDLIPPFLDSCDYGFSLVTFSAALRSIEEKGCEKS